jgi:undecaprenyl-diphosphatase
MSWYEAVALGIIQGLTEFLPISSTAHLLFARQLMGHEYPDDAFTTVIQLGTLFAVLWYFRSDVASLTAAVWRDLVTLRPASSPESRLAWLIVLGTIPAVVVGGLFKKWLKSTFYALTPMAIVVIVFAVLMALSELWTRRRAERGLPARGVEEVGWLDALWIGAWQALALMPGASRSGTTITAALFAGLARPAAARFSFLLSLPVMVGAGMKELYDEYKQLHTTEGPPSLFASSGELVSLGIGLVVSAAVGYASIAWLLGYLRRHSTAVFIVYRVVLGVAVLAAVAAGVVASRPEAPSPHTSSSISLNSR